LSYSNIKMLLTIDAVNDGNGPNTASITLFVLSALLVAAVVIGFGVKYVIKRKIYIHTRIYTYI